VEKSGKYMRKTVLADACDYGQLVTVQTARPTCSKATIRENITSAQYNRRSRMADALAIAKGYGGAGRVISTSSIPAFGTYRYVPIASGVEAGQVNMVAPDGGVPPGYTEAQPPTTFVTMSMALKPRAGRPGAAGGTPHTGGQDGVAGQAVAGAGGLAHARSGGGGQVNTAPAPAYSPPPQPAAYVAPPAPQPPAPNIGGAPAEGGGGALPSAAP